MKKVTYETQDGKDKKAIRTFVALVVCMLIFSVSAVTLYKRGMEKDMEQTAMNPTTQVAVKKTDVVKPTTTTETPTTTAKTEKSTVKTTAKTTAKTTPNTVAEFFVMPVGGIITKEYSDKKLQFDETYNDWRLHRALDIAAEKGTEIHSAGDGRVSEVYEDNLLGQVVIIDHGKGIIAHYCGVLSPRVEKGQVVRAGDVIGGVGVVKSEGVEQTHLHFAVQKDGEWVDPVKTLGIGVE